MMLSAAKRRRRDIFVESPKPNPSSPVGATHLLTEYSASYISRIVQAEEQVARGRRDGDAARAAVGANRGDARRPTRRFGEIAVLLQGARRRVRPGDSDGVARMGDGQPGHSGRLHHGDEAPETAGHGVAAAGHCAARIVLADGAADGILPVAARAAAAGYFIPVNRVGLRRCLEAESEKQKAETEQPPRGRATKFVASYSLSPLAGREPERGVPKICAAPPQREPPFII